MRWTCVILLAVLGAGAALADPPATAPAARKGYTVEKEPFPPADARTIDVDMPLVHHAIDALPEEAGFSRIYSLQSGLGPVQRWSHLLDADQVDTSAYQYIAPGTDADAVLIGLVNGRVARLGYFYPQLGSSKVHSIVAQFQDAGTDPDIQGKQFAVTIHGVRVIGDLAGKRQWTSSEPGAISFDGTHGGGYTTVQHKGTAPVLVEIGVDEIDWYIVHHPELTPAVTSALRQHTLCSGMSLNEANLSIGFSGEAVGGTGDISSYQWTKTKPQPWHSGGVSYGMDAGEAGAAILNARAAGDTRPQIVVFKWQAEFKDDHVVSFEKLQ